MQINAFQNIYNSSLADMQRSAVPVDFTVAGIPAPAAQNAYTPGVVVEISQEAKNYAQKLEEIQKTEGCQTCKNRKYVDSSNDSTVSYQTPTKIAPGEAASKIMAHEQEHVTNETSKAEQNDRKVISHSVSLQMSICPECGRMYVSGGVTRVLTAGNNKAETAEQSEQNNEKQI